MPVPLLTPPNNDKGSTCLYLGWFQRLGTAPGGLESSKDPIVPPVPLSEPIKAGASLEEP